MKSKQEKFRTIGAKGEVDMKEKKCRICEGNGAVGKNPCTTCGGLGILNPQKVAVCYSIHSSTGELIKIKEGVLGFIHVVDKITHLPVKGAAAIELRDMMNESLGVSRDGELHMVGGSMFGWHLSGVRKEISSVPRIKVGTV